jgi:hypothetical protein
VVRDITSYFREPATGSADDATVVTQVTTLERVEPRAFVDVPFLVPTFGYNRIDNRAEVTSAGQNPVAVDPCQVNPNGPGCSQPPPPAPPGQDPVDDPPFCQTNPTHPACVCQQPNPPPECFPRPVPVLIATGGIVITEMVLAPVRDWNDSSGGNGTPFDGTPGTGTVDQDDVWIEISSGTTGTETWIIRLTDSAGATFEQALGPPTVTSQTRLLTNWGLGSAPIVLVQVVDQSGLVRQTLDIVAIEQALGPVTGPDTESLTWSFFGSPTPVLQQFVRRPATINQFLPF